MKDFKIDDSLGFILNKTNRKLKNEFLQKLKEDNITPEEWAILNFLWEEDGVTPKELADLTFKDKPNTNRILGNLQKKRLITRSHHSTDRRAYQIFLTGAGKDLRVRLIPKAISLLEKATRSIDECKIKELKILLTQIYNNLV
ncbi:MarR family winged helix-turn-helix transcriptional regulator [Propionispira raffinosivorans]|uniref:MarR family winged helix-turn-helix transcriptional regulator n=1 Tax=Propionispira raffinosivorans TaxID=86959 RepID=UPI00035FC874|nr:MarR family transcriptional regulator [Propionispira raffinosivorans]